MTLRELTLKSLKELDGGRVNEAFAQAMKRAVADCEDRPDVTDARKVALQCELVPVIGEGGKHLDTVSFRFQVKDTIPTRKSRVYSASVKSGGRLAWSDESPENVSQLGLGFSEPDEVEEPK